MSHFALGQQSSARSQQVTVAREVAAELRRRRPAAASRSAARGQRFVRPAQLGAVAVRLLQVVAEDLVQLDEPGAVLLEPRANRSCSSARVDFGRAS